MACEEYFANSIRNRISTQFLKMDQTRPTNNTPSLTSELIISLLVIVAFYFWFITHGTFSIIGSEDWITLSTAYDSLAKSFLHSSAQIDPETISWEAFHVNGKTVMYFGPFPALLRLFCYIFDAELSGQLARLSCFTAAVLTFFAIGLILRLKIVSNDGLSSVSKRMLFVVSILGIAFSTPLFLLGSMVAIYHEAMWWGICGSLWCIYLTFRIQSSDDTPCRLTLLGLLTGLTLLSRATFAIPLFLVFGFYFVKCVFKDRSWGLAFASIPLLLAITFQLWYNFARFDSPLEFAPWQHYERETSERSQNSTFNPRRIVYSLKYYTLPSDSNLKDSFPWIQPRQVSFDVEGLFSTDDSEYLMPLFIIAPWFIICGMIGVFRCVSKRDKPTILLLLAFSIQVIFILSYYFVTQRYIVEFLPFLFIAYCGFLSSVNLGRASLIKVGILALVIFSSSAVNVLTTFDWCSNQWGVPEQFRTSLKLISSSFDKQQDPYLAQ